MGTCADRAEGPGSGEVFPVRRYITLTSSWYVLNALAQYLALVRLEARPVRYQALCMGPVAYAILGGLDLPGLCAVDITDFETPALVACKKDRSLAEYCWTAKSAFILSVLDSLAPGDGVTYLDADIYPFTDHSAVWSQLSGCEIILYPHRFAPALRGLEKNAGRYNAGMISLKHTAQSRRALAWWSQRSLEWCYCREENGQMGDQKYLMDFPSLFSGVEDCQDLGVNLGPWSQGLAHPVSDDGRILLDGGSPLRSYHFHQYSLGRAGGFVPVTDAVYRLEPELLRLAYEPYTQAMQEALELARSVVPGFEPPSWNAG